MSNPIPLKVKFPRSATLDEFIDRYAADLCRDGVFIRTRSPLDVGATLRFELQLQDGAPLFEGVGRVTWTRTQDADRPNAGSPGMGVGFDEVSESGREVLEKILAIKAQRGDEAAESRYEQGQRESAGAASVPTQGPSPVSSVGPPPPPRDETATPLPPAAPGLGRAPLQFGDENATRVMHLDQAQELVAASRIDPDRTPTPPAPPVAMAMDESVAESSEAVEAILPALEVADALPPLGPPARESAALAKGPAVEDRFTLQPEAASSPMASEPAPLPPVEELSIPPRQPGSDAGLSASIVDEARPVPSRVDVERSAPMPMMAAAAADAPHGAADRTIATSVASGDVSAAIAAAAAPPANPDAPAPSALEQRPRAARVTRPEIRISGVFSAEALLEAARMEGAARAEAAAKAEEAAKEAATSAASAATRNTATGPAPAASSPAPARSGSARVIFGAVAVVGVIAAAALVVSRGGGVPTQEATMPVAAQAPGLGAVAARPTGPAAPPMPTAANAALAQRPDVSKVTPISATPGIDVLFDSEPQGAAVQIDGQPAGVTPVRVSTVATGKTHVADFSRKGFKPERVSFEPKPATVLRPRLAQLPHFVEVNSTPSGGDVLLDGKKTGRTGPRPLLVPIADVTGNHTIVVRRKGYLDEERPVALTDPFETRGDKEVLPITVTLRDQASAGTVTSAAAADSAEAQPAKRSRRRRRSAAQ